MTMLHDSEWSEAIAHPLVVKLFQELDDDRKRVFHDVVARRIQEQTHTTQQGTFLPIIACRTDRIVDAVLAWGKYHDYEN